jgi:hypothetical protein
MILLVIISFGTTQNVNAQDSTFAFIINGHKYNQPEDLMMRGIHEWFSGALDSLDIPSLLDTLAAANDLTINDINLPKNINVLYKIDESETYDLLTNITMDTLSILATATGFDCEFEVDIIGAGFVINSISTYENGELKLEFGPADTVKPEISVVGIGNFLCPIIAEVIKTEMESQIDSLLLGLAMMYESESVDGLFRFLNPIQAMGIEDSLIVEQALESFPMEMDLYTAEDTDQGIVQLIVEINFLMGTVENPTEFIGIEPSHINESQLETGGFSFLYWVLQKGFPWHEDWTESQRVDNALSITEDTGLNDYRIELRWSDLQKLIYRGDLVPEDVSPEDIAELIANNDHWDTTAFIAIEEYLLNGNSRNLNPFMAIGIGHQDRMPFDDNGKRIAPATEGWEAPDDYTGISADEYLYNLKIYAHATVRKFADKISVWQIENELNAANFAAAVPDWWRKGDLWQDVNFRNQVWQILLEAVKIEDPSALIIHDFHMLGFMASLEEWKDDLDIVGVNYYPNQFAALPLMGFTIGEFVWAVRRALKGLGFGDKPVWLTETGYPGIEIENPAVNIRLEEDMAYFSESRQNDYMETALTSAVKHGAKGFFYYSLVTQEDYLGNSPSLMRFSGLIRRETDVQKPALETYSNLYKSLLNIPSKIDVDRDILPESASLSQNYPNPFNPKTIINYELRMTTDTELSIHNILGENVATLVSERKEAGRHQIEWDASDFASGVYFYRLKAGKFSDIKKMVLIK